MVNIRDGEYLVKFEKIQVKPFKLMEHLFSNLWGLGMQRGNVTES